MPAIVRLHPRGPTSAGRACSARCRGDATIERSVRFSAEQRHTIASLSLARKTVPSSFYFLGPGQEIRAFFVDDARWRVQPCSQAAFRRRMHKQCPTDSSYQIVDSTACSILRWDRICQRCQRAKGMHHSASACWERDCGRW